MLILPQIAYVYSCECPLYLLIVHEKTGGSKMEIAEMLDELKQKALHDPKLRAELLATKKASQPFAAFCSKCRELGYEIYDMDLMLYKWAECEDTTNSSKNKPKTFSMDFTGEIQKEKLEAFLAKIEPDVFRVKGFFKVEKEGWEKVDVVGKKRDYAPYEPQPKSQLVFISKIGIALIREIAAAWEECVGLPMKLNN